MNRIWIVALLVGLLAVPVLAQASITVIDQSGRTVTIPQPVESIACVYGIGTYTVYALGGGDRLVIAYYIGLKSASSASETMLRWEPRLPEILSFGDPNVEELVASGAQLVLADASQHAAVAAQLRDLGIPVVLYQAETPEAMKEAVALTGSFLSSDAVEQANEFLADYDRVVETVSADVASLADADRAQVLFLGTSPTKAISGDMYQTFLIETAGGVSVTEGLIGSWNDVNLEQILTWNPDVVVIPPYGPVQPSDILDDPDWQSLDAVRAGRVYRMPRIIAPIDTPVPESILGIVWLETTLYPDLATLDLADEVTHFYTDYYHFDLTDQELETFLGR
jgi:iron complex transport system substrate-binding protein